LSASTKPIHGGLRYLEYYEFGLVRKALREREILLRAAPHIIAPLRFVMPHDATTRPAWIIRAGLFLYDPLAKRAFLPGSRGIARWAQGCTRVKYATFAGWNGLVVAWISCGGAPSTGCTPLRHINAGCRNGCLNRDSQK
jgi:hypothetical protein